MKLVTFLLLISLSQTKATAAQELSGSAEACQTEYLAAGVSSSNATARQLVPQARQFTWTFATPEVRVKVSWENTAVQVKLPSVPLFSTKQNFTWNGSTWQGTTKTTTVGPWTTTWTADRTIRGVCVAYTSAVDEFVARR